MWLILMLWRINMSPELVMFKCPNCKTTQNFIPASMVDKTIKCPACRKYIHFGWRKHEIKIVKRPERISSSGLLLY